jgi:hypothetical protein
MRLSLNADAWDRGFQDGEQEKPLGSCPYAPRTTESWSWSAATSKVKPPEMGTRLPERPRCALRR